MSNPFSLAYTFTVSGFPADTFTVQQFRAINWKLNEDYEWEVSVLSQQLLAADSLITQAATVMLQAFHTTEYYHSVIGFIHHTRHPDATGHYRYTFTLRSPLHPLQHSAHNWVYREQSVLDMAKTVLSRLPTPLTLDDNDVTKSYPTRDMVIQYHESDYAFLQRLLSEAGIGFALWQEETGVTLRLFDNHLANFPDADAPLPYIPSGNQVPSDASVSYVNAFYTAMVPQTVQLYTYQYETPEAERHVSVTSTHPLASHGTWEYRRQSYRDLTDGQALATLRVQAFDVQRHHIRADTDDMSLQPGMRVTLTGHAESQYTGDFHIISMEVGGCQPPEPGQPRDASLFITTPYANTLTLLPVATPYVPPYIEAPRHTESVIAWVDSPESDATYPYLDEWGRYKLRFPFDEANHPKGDASGWVRALQPFGGKGKGPMGAHFAYRPGTEVVVKGMDGDINEPVILGALNNAESPSVHKTRHAKQQLLYTWGGNEAMLNDDPDQTEARLSTKGRDNRLYFYDEADDDDGTQPGKRHQQAELVSENGIVTLACDALFHASAGDSATYIAGASHISTTHGHHTETTSQGQVQRGSGAGMTQTASRHVVNKTHDHSITFKTPQDITVNATQHIGIHSVKGNISLTAPRDSVHIQHGQAFHVQGTGTGPVTMKGGKSSMQFTKDGEAIIQAPKIIIEADDIHFHGDVVYNNGTAASGMTTTGVGTDVTEKQDATPEQQQVTATPAAAQASAVVATPGSDADTPTSGTISSSPTACQQLWQPLDAASQAIVNTPDDMARNQKITQAYAKLYLENPNLIWAGVAAFASKQVGCVLKQFHSMGFHAEEMAVAEVVGTVAYEPGKALYQSLIRGNNAAFLGIVPVLQFYDQYGIEKLTACQTQREFVADLIYPDSKGISTYSFKRLDTDNLLPGMVAIDKGDILNGAKDVLRYEQFTIQQKITYASFVANKLLTFDQSIAQSSKLREIGGQLGVMPMSVAFSASCSADAEHTIEFKAPHVWDYNQRWPYAEKVVDKFIELNEENSVKMQAIINNLADG